MHSAVIVAPESRCTQWRNSVSHLSLQQLTCQNMIPNPCRARVGRFQAYAAVLMDRMVEVVGPGPGVRDWGPGPAAPVGPRISTPGSPTLNRVEDWRHARVVEFCVPVWGTI